MGAADDWLIDATALEVTAAMNERALTSEELVTHLRERVSTIDAPGTEIELRSVIALSETASAEARQLDAERRAGTVRGPLHGVAVLIKDNIQAVGLPGTAGSTALLGRPVASDAPLVRRLRDAGLVVLGSTNLSQWANMRSPFSTSGWSAVGGLGVNPYRLDRCAGGSSSGSGAALAARLAPLAVGTETDGSITCPASLNGVVGLKPGVGCVSADGVVPLSASQDSPGPMARTVLDTAALFEVVSGRTGAVAHVREENRDVRVGVARSLMTGHASTDSLFWDVVRGLRADGVASREVDVALADASVDTDEQTVLLCEMHDDLSAYLARRGGVGPTSLREVIAFEDEHADVELAYFGHEFFVESEQSGGRAGAHYADARARNLHWAIDKCLEPAMRDIECYVAPCYSPAWKNDLALGGSGSARWSQVTQAPAIAGWPIATVPMGLLDGLPVGLSVVGRPGSESTLLGVCAHVERVVGLVRDHALRPGFEAPRRG